MATACRYRVARPCAEIVAMCTGVEGGVKGLKCPYVLGISTSLSLLCLVVIIETRHLNTSAYNECRYRVASVSLASGQAQKVLL